MIMCLAQALYLFNITSALYLTCCDVLLRHHGSVFSVSLLPFQCFLLHKISWLSIFDSSNVMADMANPCIFSPNTHTPEDPFTSATLNNPKTRELKSLGSMLQNPTLATFWLCDISMSISQPYGSMVFVKFDLSSNLPLLPQFLSHSLLSRFSSHFHSVL